MVKFSILNIEISIPININININVFRKTRVKHSDHNENTYVKRILCGKLDAFYLFPDFEFENVQDFQIKSQLVLKTMRDLIREFPCKDIHEISYLAKNFGLSHVTDNDELYDELLKKEWNLNLNEDWLIFDTGLRSVSAILSWNIKNISIDRIIGVKENLKPIAINFKRKELLIN